MLENRSSTRPPLMRKVAFWFLSWILVACAASFIATHVYLRAFSSRQLADLPFWAGPSTRSFLEHHDFNIPVNINPDGSGFVLHSARMPVVPFFLAICWLCFGPGSLTATVALKTTGCVLILATIVWRVLCMTKDSVYDRLSVLALLTAPFAMTAILADIVNVQLEEGYSFLLLALTSALLFFTSERQLRAHSLRWSLTVGSLCALTYLSKSSMLPVAVVFSAAACYRLSRTGERVIIVVVLLLAPLCWGIHQERAGGRFTTGTSVDSINLHKGNNETFLDHYPPSDLTNLDFYDSELNRGMNFRSEWQLSDWHKKEALKYIRTHPREDAIATWRKFEVFFFSLKTFGSGLPKNAAVTLVGMLLFRLIFLGAVLMAIVSCFRRSPRETWIPMTFLALVAACTLPYVVGFGYIRHASVLIWPSALLLARLRFSRSES